VVANCIVSNALKNWAAGKKAKYGGGIRFANIGGMASLCRAFDHAFTAAAARRTRLPEQEKGGVKQA